MPGSWSKPNINNACHEFSLCLSVCLSVCLSIYLYAGWYVHKCGSNVRSTFVIIDHSIEDVFCVLLCIVLPIQSTVYALEYMQTSICCAVTEEFVIWLMRLCLPSGLCIHISQGTLACAVNISRICNFLLKCGYTLTHNVLSQLSIRFYILSVNLVNDRILNCLY